MGFFKRLFHGNEEEMEIGNGDGFYSFDEMQALPESTTNQLTAQAESKTATDAEKVSVKLMQPRSHGEATKISDMLKERCIVLLDISLLPKENAVRLLDFLAGVIYVLDGQMMKTNKTTIVVAPAGVDISNFTADEEEPEEQETTEY